MLKIIVLENDRLSPIEGVHRNLSTDSLIGWTECYRSTNDVPFNMTVLTKNCNGSRLLVACRSTNEKKILKLAAVGHREDIFHSCVPKQCSSQRMFKQINRTCSNRYHCVTQAKRGVGWYLARNQSWGFVRGSLSFVINPCDTSDLDADYRLCWTMKTNRKASFSDRCGAEKIFQQANKWERIIYDID